MKSGKTEIGHESWEKRLAIFPQLTVPIFLLPIFISHPGGLRFCDTFRHAGLGSAVPACFPRPAAWRCPDFPLPAARLRERRQRSSATRK